MFASSVCLGKVESQLPLKNQLEVNVPVQLVWACVETVDAAKSATIASNLDETTLARRRVPVTSRPHAVLWTTVDAVRIPFQALTNLTIKNWATTARRAN